MKDIAMKHALPLLVALLAFPLFVKDITPPESAFNVVEQEDGTVFLGVDQLNNPPPALDLATYNTAGDTLVIPETVNGKPVTGLMPRAFEDFDKIVGIELPDGLVAIGDDAFFGCKALTKVTFGTKVITIGDRAFQGCASLPSITVPEGVATMGRAVFMQCSALKEVSLPNTLTTLVCSKESAQDLKRLVATLPPDLR